MMEEQQYRELWPVYAHNWPNVVNSCNAITEVRYSELHAHLHTQSKTQI